MTEQSEAMTEFGEAVQRYLEPIREAVNQIGQAFANAGLQVQRDWTRMVKAVWRSPSNRKAMRQRAPSAQGMYATYAAYRKNQAAKRYRRR